MTHYDGDLPVLRRDLVKQVRGETVQLQTSVIPLELVQGTPVADPARQPWPGGTIAELYSIGLVVTRVREEARYRTPTPHERRELGIETTSGVLEVVRVFYVGDRPVEFSTAVVEANSYTLLYETTIN
jgi:GntR family transcriptional regulator